jgi:hypothetical protein
MAESDTSFAFSGSKLTYITFCLERGGCRAIIYCL